MYNVMTRSIGLGVRDVYVNSSNRKVRKQQIIFLSKEDNSRNGLRDLKKLAIETPN